MNYYLVHLSLSKGQSQIIDQLRSQKCDVIQTSDGLCVKTGMSEAELANVCGTAKVERIDARTAESDPALSADIKAFLKS